VPGVVSAALVLRIVKPHASIRSGPLQWTGSLLAFTYIARWELDGVLDPVESRLITQNIKNTDRLQASVPAELTSISSECSQGSLQTYRIFFIFGSLELLPAQFLILFVVCPF